MHIYIYRTANLPRPQRANFTSILRIKDHLYRVYVEYVTRLPTVCINLPMSWISQTHTDEAESYIYTNKT